MERYLDGELLPEKLRNFEDHLRSCVKCRQVLEQKREQRRQRVWGLMPNEVPISTEEILEAVYRESPETMPKSPLEALTGPSEPKWWEKFKSFAFRPAPAIAFALCIIALGLSLFLPFGTHKLNEAGIVIEEIESSGSVVIFQPEHTNTTIIWMVPPDKTEEAT